MNTGHSLFALSPERALLLNAQHIRKTLAWVHSTCCGSHASWEVVDRLQTENSSEDSN